MTSRALAIFLLLGVAACSPDHVMRPLPARDCTLGYIQEAEDWCART